ncbi:uncharacterized protein LOC133178166 [Saccostrea echinata]|uniref:uncharacterized protein LOC133178166 n=1 Tax=Saccostrea echinata TaxID=191078 RepID=UPI002A8158CC|nr:uncharacterized protein LOC133178166 [Saccostrea echinata]
MPECVPVDLIFVMDDSGSVVKSNFQTMLSFASDLLNAFTIGVADTQVGLIVFSTNVRRIFNFNAYSSRSAIQNAIRSTSYTGKGTNTAAALLEARQMFTSNYAKRSSALSLAIVLTDGRSNDQSATLLRAQELINTGAMIFCIGIGTNLDESELRAIASNPDSKFLINANDFTTLHSKITQLTNSLCIDNVVPDFMTCDMEIQDRNGERSPHSVPSNQPTSCSYQTDFYGKYQVDSVSTSITVEAEYTGSTPAAVDDFHYGITELSIERVERSIGGYDTRLGIEQININNPPQRLVSSDKTIQNSGNLINGERFCLIYTAKAGGYVTFGGKTYTYSDTVATKTRCYFYDSDPPQHCKILGTCTESPVIVSSPLTKSPVVTISFQGWQDVSPAASSIFASGIQHYELYVREMVNGVPGKLTMDTTPQTGTLQCKTCSSFTVSLPTGNQPMLYAFVLEAVDVALNVRQARSFILYDNVSTIVTHSLHSLVVTSASMATNRKWQTNQGNVCYSWQNLFYNDKFVHYNPLLPVEPEPHGLIPSSYDIFPGQFSQSGTKNIHGIVKFTYSVSKEKKNIFLNETIKDVTNETICLSVPDMKDGEIISFSITAIDISLNKLTDSTYHYIDSTPPIIEDTWLIKNGRSQLFVHNSKDLSKMTMEFESFDLHSGLFKIEWVFGTLDDRQILGQGAIGIRKLNASVCSLESKCYCPMKGDCEHYNFSISLNSLIANNTHIGNHHREYYFEIEATNNALLHKINKLEIFVDNSPPEEGKVFDGPPDGKELDYTDSEEIWFWWQGFNDHESGIMFYRVEISNTCLTQQNQSHINYPSKVFTFDIEESKIKLNVNETGSYIATVTAFNYAYEASIPVCSDGILYDTTPPVISTVKVHNMKMAPAIGCLNGETWFITESVEKYRLEPSSECFTLCSNKSDHDMLKFIPESAYSTENWSCSDVKDFDKTVFYLPNSKIYVNWTAFDNESDIMDVFMGFGSSLSSRVSPDIMDFTLTPHQQYVHIYHSGLSSSSLFYLFVKVVNKAGKDSIVSIGPNIIDETAPVCVKKPNITIKNITVVVSWTSDTFQDTEQEEEIGTIHFRLRKYTYFFN